MIPYKEHVAHKAVEAKASTTCKPTLEDEENWDEELPLPPHETLPVAKPVLVEAVVGIDENVSAENLSDVEWKEDDPLFEFNDENVTIPQTPDAALTPVQTLTENKTGSSLKSPLKKKPCFQESIAVCLLKAATPLHLKPDYSDAELVGYTRPPLVNVIPWIKYEAQNMVEPTFRQELQCIREVDHLWYIIAMIVWLVN